MKKQQGVTLSGLLVVCFIFAFVALLGMKVAPAYIEYFKIKKAVTGIIQSGEVRGGTVGDVRTAFDRRSAVDDFEAVRPNDLDITKEGNEMVISFAYTKKIPLFANLSLVIDFEGRSK